MRYLVVMFIQSAQKGQVIRTRGLYSAIYSALPGKCQQLGLTASKPIEEKFKNDIRFGLRDAQDQGLIKHVGTPKSGLWERI
jgi:hypothetical protein